MSCLEMRTNGAWPYVFTNLDSTWVTIAAVNAYNPAWKGKVTWWTNSSPVTTQLRVRATTPGWSPIVGYAQWDSTVTNGVILSQYSHQSSGNWWTYTDTNRVFPIWSAENPDLVFETGGWGDALLTNAIGTLSLVKGGFPRSDIVDVGYHLINGGIRSDALEQRYCLSAGISFFDGQGASLAAWGSYANAVSTGLYSDGVHLTAAGYASFSQLLWSWMGLGNYSPPNSPPLVRGVTTNLSIGGMTLYITNGIIGRVSSP